MSSLAWAQANRVNSSLAHRGNIAFITLSMHFDDNVAVATHIPGILNVVFDWLSRNVSPSDLGLDVSKEFNAANDASRVYNSTWKKWTVFMQTCHHNPTDDEINCKDVKTSPKTSLTASTYQDITNYYYRNIVRAEKHPTDEICHVRRIRPWHAQGYESSCISPPIYTPKPLTMYIFNGSSYHRPAHTTRIHYCSSDVSRRRGNGISLVSSGKRICFQDGGP